MKVIFLTLLAIHFLMQSFIDICEKLVDIIANEPPILQLTGDFIVISDLHGNLKSLDYIISEAPKSYKKLFLGDYIDRGSDSIPVLQKIFELKLKYPHDTYLLMGNHEEPHGINTIGDRLAEHFKIKVTSPEHERITKITKKVFRNLSIVAIVNQKFFCVHAGIPEITGTVFDLGYQKPLEFWDQEQICMLNIAPPEIKEKYIAFRQMMWNDLYDGPAKHLKEYRPGWFAEFFDGEWQGIRTIKFIGKFNEAVLTKFLANHNCEMLVRGHEYKSQGYEFAFNGKCCTVSSSHNYFEGTNTPGGCAVITGLELQIVTFLNVFTGTEFRHIVPKSFREEFNIKSPIEVKIDDNLYCPEYIIPLRDRVAKPFRYTHLYRVTYLNGIDYSNFSDDDMYDSYSNESKYKFIALFLDLPSTLSELRSVCTCAMMNDGKSLFRCNCHYNSEGQISPLLCNAVDYTFHFFRNWAVDMALTRHVSYGKRAEMIKNSSRIYNHIKTAHPELVTPRFELLWLKWFKFNGVTPVITAAAPPEKLVPLSKPPLKLPLYPPSIAQNFVGSEHDFRFGPTVQWSLAIDMEQPTIFAVDSITDFALISDNRRGVIKHLRFVNAKRHGIEQIHFSYKSFHAKLGATVVRNDKDEAFVVVLDSDSSFHIVPLCTEETLRNSSYCYPTIVTQKVKEYLFISAISENQLLAVTRGRCVDRYEFIDGKLVIKESKTFVADHPIVCVHGRHIVTERQIFLFCEDKSIALVLSPHMCDSIKIVDYVYSSEHEVHVCKINSKGRHSVVIFKELQSKLIVPYYKYNEYMTNRMNTHFKWSNLSSGQMMIEGKHVLVVTPFGATIRVEINFDDTIDSETITSFDESCEDHSLILESPRSKSYVDTSLEFYDNRSTDHLVIALGGGNCVASLSRDGCYGYYKKL